MYQVDQLGYVSDTRNLLAVCNVSLITITTRTKVCDGVSSQCTPIHSLFICSLCLCLSLCVCVCVCVCLSNNYKMSLSFVHCQLVATQRRMFPIHMALPERGSPLVAITAAENLPYVAPQPNWPSMWLLTSCDLDEGDSKKAPTILIFLSSSSQMSSSSTTTITTKVPVLN